MILIKEPEKQANYYRKQQKVYEYAMEFWKEIVACGNRMEVNDDVLPIQCFNEMETIVEAVEHSDKIRVTGIVNSFKNKQSVIRIGINGDNDRLSVSLKRTIRHEVMHYFLWLMDMPWDDDSLEFWCLCHAFDGGAYKTLNDTDKHKYDLFVQVYDSKIKVLPDNIRRIIIGSAISKLNKSDDYFTDGIEEDIAKLKMLFRL